MVDLKKSEIRVIDEALHMESGYVLDFSDRTFAEFFDDEFGINIYCEKYIFNGSSKAKRMRAFIACEDEYTVSRVLRRIWEHHENLPSHVHAEDNESIKRRFFDILAKIENKISIPRTDAIEMFTRDQTLEELVASIEREITANKPASALDRLHTYCMKRFGYLLDIHGVTWERQEPLHSRVGKYAKVIESTYQMHDTSRQIIKSSIGIFDKFNHVRNNGSLAHDNDLLFHAEARFIFDSITSILRFVKCLESSRINF